MDYTIGIIGGGQLAKMLIEAGLKWNIKFNILESDKSDSICEKLANKIIRGSLHDSGKIKEIVESSDVTTYEIENINVEELIKLKEMGHVIIPHPEILSIVKDKGVQKSFYRYNGIPTSNFQITNNFDDLDIMIKNWESDYLVVKSCVGGYDGRGVEIVKRADYLSGIFNKTIFEEKCWERAVIEEFINCKKELSVIVACDGNQNVIYPSTEMIFAKTNVLDYQLCPARISHELELKAGELAKLMVSKLPYSTGLFAIEMFLTDDDTLLVNEIAPRPHNSGHHTIEGNYTSQFEQLLRILIMINLGPVDIIKPSLLVNLLEPNGCVGKYYFDMLQFYSEFPNAHVHLYGKQPSNPGRKLGHLTILGENTDDLLNKLEAIKAYKIEPFIELDEMLELENDKPSAKQNAIVGVIMGSTSDVPTMQDAIDILKYFNIPHEVNIVSAHRTPERMFNYAKEAEGRGLQVIIAGAGGAAHLPGMTASLTNLPVIGVPVKTLTMSGLDSLYSIVQMPIGVPVATMAINGSKNAGLLAIRILANHDVKLKNKLNTYHQNMKEMVSTI